MMEQSYKLETSAWPKLSHRARSHIRWGEAVLTCLLSFCGAGAVLFVFCMCDTVSSPTLLSISTPIHLLCSANYLTLSVKSVTWRTMHGFSSRQNDWEREMTWIALCPQGDGDVHVCCSMWFWSSLKWINHWNSNVLTDVERQESRRPGRFYQVKVKTETRKDTTKGKRIKGEKLNVKKTEADSGVRDR